MTGLMPDDPALVHFIDDVTVILQDTLCDLRSLGYHPCTIEGLTAKLAQLSDNIAATSAGIGATACIILDAMELGLLVDDRPAAGNSPSLHDRFQRKVSAPKV